MTQRERDDALVSQPADATAERVVLPLAAEPAVSVVVLAWRLSYELEKCLAALAASEEAPPFETIVVLNGADDAVREAVARTGGVRIVDLPVNVGYGDGCNAGAGVASGRHIVLLNDDALIDRGWLQALVRAADADPSVGAVGSLLLESDGVTVQEVGARIAADGQPRPWGRELPLPEVERRGLLAARAVDFASGAALLVRRDAFLRVGGFDPIYRPAYYEDVDLCFRIRQAGWEVVVEPTARVTHVSGGSTAGYGHFRDFAVEHAREAFRARWERTLAAAPAVDAAPDERCDPGLDPVPSRLRRDESPERVALGIARSYQTWLIGRLDRLEVVERVALARLRSLEQEAADIRSRGPLGLVRWRIGVWYRKRAGSAEQPAGVADTLSGGETA